MYHKFIGLSTSVRVLFLLPYCAFTRSRYQSHIVGTNHTIYHQRPSFSTNQHPIIHQPPSTDQHLIINQSLSINQLLHLYCIPASTISMQPIIRHMTFSPIRSRTINTIYTAYTLSPPTNHITYHIIIVYQSYNRPPNHHAPIIQ